MPSMLSIKYIVKLIRLNVLYAWTIIQIGRQFLWNENNVYISLDEYRKMHWTISINNMQRVKWRSIDTDARKYKA